MNSAHDLGGRHGFGPIAPEAENSEPVFHKDWERKALALVLAAGSLGQWNLDESRLSRESQHPVIRGASWAFGAFEAAGFFRGYSSPNLAWPDVGIRCGRDI